MDVFAPSRHQDMLYRILMSWKFSDKLIGDFPLDAPTPVLA